MTSAIASSAFEPEHAIADNRLVGLWRVLRGYRFLYFQAMVGVSISALAKMGTFLLLRDLVDRVIGQNQADSNTLLIYALGFVALATIEGSFTFFSGRLVAHTAESIAKRLRNLLFDHVQRLSFTYHSKAKTGDLIQRSTSDVDALRRFYSEQAIGIGRLAVPFVINLVAILSLHWQLGLLSIIMIPVICIVSVFFFKRINKTYEDFQNQESVLSTTLQENLTGVRVVKAFARQEYEQDKFDKDNREKFRLGRRHVIWHALYWPSADSLAWIQMLIGWGVGATLAINGSISIGTYLAYSGLLTQIVWPIRNMGRLIVQTTTGLVSYNRIADILREEREPVTVGTYTPTGNIRGDVVFSHVNFAYADDDADKPPVLNDITFEVEAGTVVALLGSTGSGKTSLVNLLPRFHEYTGGSVTLDDIELNRYPRHYLRRQIGIVEQEPMLFSRTIRENITYGVGRECADSEVEAAARAAAIHDVILSFPNGYNTLVGERGVTLSGGQKQRVALARTLLKNPRILILDDSTSSVDPETEGEIREALNQLMKNRTTFIIAHRIQSVMIADLILVMDKGRIVQMGSHDELMAQEGTYRQVYDLQSRIDVELEKELQGVGL